LKDISITIDKDRLKVKGKLHQKGDIGFETEGQLSATADGKIRLHAEKIRALHLPVKGLMDLFGLDIADLIKNGKVRGVQVEKDDLILDPGEILPPPKIPARLLTFIWKATILFRFSASRKNIRGSRFQRKTTWRIAATGCSLESC